MNWNEESNRQNDMAERAREILLRWGEFSEDYVEKAGFLSKTSNLNVSEFCTTMICLNLLAPALAVIPFLIDLKPMSNASD